MDVRGLVTFSPENGSYQGAAQSPAASFFPLQSLFLNLCPWQEVFFPLSRRIAAWPMVSVPQPSQPRLRNDPDNVAQVLPAGARPALDGHQAITGREAQGELRQLPADTGAGCNLGEATVARPLGVDLVADNAQTASSPTVY